MGNYGLYGPFKNPKDISRFWYQVEEKELKEQIERVKADLEDLENPKELTGTHKKGSQGILLPEPKMTKEDIETHREILKKDLEELSTELNNLQDFVDDYNRCLERYKRDGKTLKEIQEDWEEYNNSLYTDYCRIQAGIFGGREEWEGERLEERRREARKEIIKREEIERRIINLLKAS